MSNIFSLGPPKGGSFTPHGRGPIDPPREPPHDGGMDDVLRRISALEGDTKDIKADLRALVKDVSELKGRASAMPTMWQLLTMILAVIGVVATFSIFTMNRVDRVEAKLDTVISRLPPPQAPIAKP